MFSNSMRVMSIAMQPSHRHKFMKYGYLHFFIPSLQRKSGNSEGIITRMGRDNGQLPKNTCQDEVRKMMLETTKQHTSLISPKLDFVQFYNSISDQQGQSRASRFCSRESTLVVFQQYHQGFQVTSVFADLDWDTRT